MEQQVGPHERLDALAACMFRVFTRAEFALKHGGYAKPITEAKPDWIAFGGAAEEAVSKSDCLKLREAVSYLVKCPPKQETMDGTTVHWVCSPADDTWSDVRKALFYARRVRNNLFHGGKVGTHELEGRDETLITHSITVIEAFVDAVPRVRQKYRGEAPSD